MDQHKIKHNKKTGGEISLGGIPFAIDVKEGEKEKENKKKEGEKEKGGDC